MNYAYYVPVPGLDENGKEVTCTQKVVMTEDDAIQHQRWITKQVKKDLDLSPEDLLDEYIVVNWAEKGGK